MFDALTVVHKIGVWLQIEIRDYGFPPSMLLLERQAYHTRGR